MPGLIEWLNNLVIPPTQSFRFCMRFRKNTNIFPTRHSTVSASLRKSHPLQLPVFRLFILSFAMPRLAIILSRFAPERPVMSKDQNWLYDALIRELKIPAGNDTDPADSLRYSVWPVWDAVPLPRLFRSMVLPMGMLIGGWGFKYPARFSYHRIPTESAGLQSRSQRIFG